MRHLGWSISLAICFGIVCMGPVCKRAIIGAYAGNEGNHQPEGVIFPVPKGLDQVTGDPDRRIVAALHDHADWYRDRVLFLLWNDGTVLWLEGYDEVVPEEPKSFLEPVPYGPLYLAQVSQQSLTDFFDELENGNFFEDPGVGPHGPFGSPFTELLAISEGRLLSIRTLLEYETESTVLAHDGVFVEVPPEQKPEYVLYLSTEENLRHREVYETTKQAMFKLIESIDPEEAENVGHLEFEWKRHLLADYVEEEPE